jgi:hemolysin III
VTTTQTSNVVRAQRDVPLGSPTRPSWRGRLHLLTLILVTPLSVLAVVDARGGAIRIGVAVYAAGLCSMFLVSTTYHRWVHTMRARAAWRRADHVMIFVAIAATSTPVCLTLFSAGSAAWRLAAIWTIAGIGVVAKASGTRRGNLLGNALYIVNGWAGVAMLPALWAHGDVTATVLLMVGGVVYTVGAVGFARRWPRLRPSVFGYHEVWHAATITAAGTHLVAVWMITS